MISEDVFEYLAAPIRRVTSLDVPVAFSPAWKTLCKPDTRTRAWPHVVRL